MTHEPPIDCICNHSWEDHHHGCIMNPNVPSENHTRGICRGVLAQECEATQVNGEWLVRKKKDRCYCGSYRNPIKWLDVILDGQMVQINDKGEIRSKDVNS